MSVVIFDLDKKLIGGDSDFLWEDSSMKPELLMLIINKKTKYFINNMKWESKIILPFWSFVWSRLPVTPGVKWTIVISSL